MPNILIESENILPDPSLGAFLRADGYQAWTHVRATMTALQAIDTIEKAGLTGKGGAGFPTHKKMRLMLRQPGEKKFLVVNGSEHEPGSLKDSFLLEHYPHKVLEGALLAAHVVRASDVVLAINEASTAAVSGFRRALIEAQDDPAVDFAGIVVTVQTVPDIYIVGEETALLEVLEGKKPLPRKKPPFPIETGLHGVPTLIQNVETVVHLPFILTGGAEAYRALGVYGKGVTLCTLGAEFVRSGIFEIPLGTPISGVLYDWGGGLRDGSQIKAIQPGGPSSGFLPPASFDLPLDAETMTAHGSALGCAVIRAYSDKDCMVREIGEIMHFFAHGSCGQCPRCRMETNMFDTILRQTLSGKGSWKLLDQVDKLIELAKGEGICTLINMPVAPLKTGLAIFRDEFQAHIEHACPHCDNGSRSVASVHASEALKR